MLEERPIAFNVLAKDELEYEIRIRGAKPSADTVIALRAQIRALNKEIPSDEIDSVEFEVSSELDIIKAKLDSLSDLVSGAAQKPCSLKILNRVQALGHHLFHRFGRLVAPKEGDDLYSQFVSLQERLERLLRRLDRIFCNFKSSITPAEDDNPLTEPSSGEKLGNNTEISNNNRPSCDKHSAIHTLNLKFNGKSCVKAFIQRLEELTLSRGISDTKLFNSAAELFVDEALCWYRGVRDEVKDWSGLKDLLLDEYLPFDYDHRLLQEIRTRTQGHDESIVNYLSVMQNYFSRLSKPISDDEKLNIVLYNIRPFYTTQLALNPTESWSDLKKKCRLLENAKQRSELFSEPSKPGNSSIAPDLGYKNASSNRPGPRVAAVKSDTEDFCVRCRVNGHILSRCRAPFTLICYRCGGKGVTLKNCPKCSSSNAESAVPKNESA